MGLYVPEFWLYSSTALYNLLVLTESHDPPLQCFWGLRDFRLYSTVISPTRFGPGIPHNKDFPVQFEGQHFGPNPGTKSLKLCATSPVKMLPGLCEQCASAA